MTTEVEHLNMAGYGTLLKAWIGCAVLALSHALNASTFDLTILHTNDVHSRIEQFNKYGNPCTESDEAEGKCFGGVARLKTKVDEIRNNNDHVLLLDAGDQFVGSLWFSVYKGLASSFFMNILAYDAMCFGNHEFDYGVDGMLDFLNNITFPMVGANIEAINQSPLRGQFKKSITLTVVEEKIGVIGYITPTTAVISAPGENIQFTDVIEAVQAQVDRLTNRGVNKIIALGHAGFATDLEVAQIEGVDVVIGGFTDTFLYNGEPPSIEEPEGPYPTVVTRSSGHKALVVQAYTWAKYLGHLDVTFNSEGEMVNWSGNPVLLNSSIEEDPTIKAVVDEWAIPVNDKTSEVVGTSNVFLNGNRRVCRTRECNLGNLITDALVDYHLTFAHPNNTWAPAALAMWDAGGIRTSIDKGDVSIGDLSTVLVFNNEIYLLKLNGSVLREMLEHSVRGLNKQEPEGKFLQFSGLRVVYDSRRVHERVISVHVLCLECDVPSYFPLNDDAEYNVLTNNYIADGGAGFDTRYNELIRYDSFDSDVLSAYFKKHSPVVVGLDGRITFINPDEDKCSGSTNTSASVTMILMILIGISINIL